MDDAQRATRNSQWGAAANLCLLQGTIILADLDDRGD
jgi:hypothetical protein